MHVSDCLNLNVVEWRASVHTLGDHKVGVKKKNHSAQDKSVQIGVRIGITLHLKRTNGY